MNSLINFSNSSAKIIKKIKMQYIAINKIKTSYIASFMWDYSAQITLFPHFCPKLTQKNGKKFPIL